MAHKLGLAKWDLFTTTKFSTGEAFDATGTPTAVAYKNGVADALAVTVAKIAATTGVYSWTCTPTVAAGFAATDNISIIINATIDGVAAVGRVWNDILTTADIDSLTAAVGSPLQSNTTGSGLSAVPWNSAWDAEVQSECDDALVANNLDHLMKTPVANRTNMTAEVADDTVLANIMTKTDGDTSDYVIGTDSLESIADEEADIKANTADIQTRIPATLVSGRIDASVGAVANDAITAASIATGAIDADAIADNAIDAGAIATDAITAAKIAADAIGSSELAASAVTEIAAGVSLGTTPDGLVIGAAIDNIYGKAVNKQNRNGNDFEVRNRLDNATLFSYRIGPNGKTPL